VTSGEDAPSRFSIGIAETGGTANVSAAATERGKIALSMKGISIVILTGASRIIWSRDELEVNQNEVIALTSNNLDKNKYRISGAKL
jgi:hypothetical protein